MYVGKSVGAYRLTWIPLLLDPEAGVPTWGTPVRLSRLIQITRTPILATGELESDDGIEDDTSKLVGWDVAINASQLTDPIRAALLGHALDATGGMLISEDDEAAEGALLWEEKISNNVSGPAKYKKWVLYKGKFQEFAETANTAVRSGITYQTHNLTGRFLRRNDGRLGYTMRGDTPGASAAKMAAWFDVPQEPEGDFGSDVAIPVASPAAGAVASGTNINLTTATPSATIRYTTDGSRPDATSMPYDGPITVNAPVTIRAIAIKAGMNTSDELSAEYTLS